MIPEWCAKEMVKILEEKMIALGIIRDRVCQLPKIVSVSPKPTKWVCVYVRGARKILIGR